MTKEKPSRSHLAPFRAHTNQHTDTPPPKAEPAGQCDRYHARLVIWSPISIKVYMA